MHDKVTPCHSRSLQPVTNLVASCRMCLWTFIICVVKRCEWFRRMPRGWTHDALYNRPSQKLWRNTPHPSLPHAHTHTNSGNVHRTDTLGKIRLDCCGNRRLSVSASLGHRQSLFTTPLNRKRCQFTFHRFDLCRSDRTRSNWCELKLNVFSVLYCCWCHSANSVQTHTHTLSVGSH